MSADADEPFEPFKRATIATMRALAGDDELEVAFGQGSPTLRGNRARVPLPQLGSDATEISAVRGIADAFALRIAHHDPDLHAVNRPPAGPGLDLYESVEEARCNAMGARRMEGVADNLDACPAFIGTVCQKVSAR